MPLLPMFQAHASLWVHGTPVCLPEFASEVTQRRINLVFWQNVHRFGGYAHSEYPHLKIITDILLFGFMHQEHY